MIKAIISLLFAITVSTEGIHDDNHKPIIIYINDPLCSWCYGFAPEAEKIREKYKDVAEFRVIEGGLQPDAKNPMSEELKNSLKEHWEEIHETTGQPFSYEILKSKDFVYNTEVPCRAVITMRKLKPEAAYDFLKEIQKAFYVKNKNTNKIDTYLEILPQFGVAPNEFTSLFQSEEMKAETQKEFNLVDSWGIYGFPSIIIKNGDKVKLITDGYQTFGKLEKKIDKELLIK